MGNRKKIAIILLAILVILLAAAGSYYIYSSIQKGAREKEKLQQQIDELKKKTDQEKSTTETQKESSTKETPATPCASTLNDSDKLMIETWKTYENTTHKYSFKYPENWVTTENKSDSVTLTDEADKTTFQLISGESGGSTDGLKKTSEKEAVVACEKATVRYYETIAAVSGSDRYIHSVFKKNNTFFMVDLSYKFIGASLSSDIVEAYDLILKTIEFK